MAIFVATYRYQPRPDELARLRPERYAFFRRLESEGSLLASGQLLDGALAEGLLVVEASGLEQATRLLDGDPFVQAGLVAERILAPWHPTAGVWLKRP